MAALPTGTVTFLFTDVEGSTLLLERLKDGYAAVLAKQRELIRSAIARWNGYEVDTEGDSFFAAFSRAADAVACVIEAQRLLAAHPWPEETSVRVAWACIPASRRWCHPVILAWTSTAPPALRQPVMVGRSCSHAPPMTWRLVNCQPG